MAPKCAKGIVGMKNFIGLEKEIVKALDLINELRQENVNLRAKIKAMQQGEALFEELKKENFALQKKQEVVKLKIEKIIHKLNGIRPDKQEEEPHG